MDGISEKSYLTSPNARITRYSRNRYRNIPRRRLATQRGAHNALTSRRVQLDSHIPKYVRLRIFQPIVTKILPCIAGLKDERLLLVLTIHVRRWRRFVTALYNTQATKKNKNALLRQIDNFGIGLMITYQSRERGAASAMGPVRHWRHAFMCTAKGYK